MSTITNNIISNLQGISRYYIDIIKHKKLTSHDYKGVCIFQQRRCGRSFIFKDRVEYCFAFLNMPMRDRVKKTTKLAAVILLARSCFSAISKESIFDGCHCAVVLRFSH